MDYYYDYHLHNPVRRLSRDREMDFANALRVASSDGSADGYKWPYVSVIMSALF